MDVLDLRESVSAATHGAALIAAIPAVAVLLHRGRSNLARTAALLAYGSGLLLCFGASTACHALVVAGLESRAATMMDHIAIYLLIAGTYTPIVAALLPPRRRRPTLLVIWTAAAAGGALNLAMGPMPAWLATSVYLAMGWGGLWCYAGMRPRMSHRQLARVPLGGVFYTIGAVFHVLKRPVLWPGVFGSHELFHVLVIAGAAAHFTFVFAHVAGGPKPATVRRPVRRGLVVLGPPRPSFTGRCAGRLVVRLRRSGA